MKVSHSSLETVCRSVLLFNTEKSLYLTTMILCNMLVTNIHFFAFSGEMQAVIQKNMKLQMKDKKPAIEKF